MSTGFSSFPGGTGWIMDDRRVRPSAASLGYHSMQLKMASRPSDLALVSFLPFSAFAFSGAFSLSVVDAFFWLDLMAPPSLAGALPPLLADAAEFEGDGLAAGAAAAFRSA